MKVHVFNFCLDKTELIILEIPEKLIFFQGFIQKKTNKILKYKPYGTYMITLTELMSTKINHLVEKNLMTYSNQMV